MNSKENDHLRGKEIDLSQIDLDRMKMLVADMPGLMEYAHCASSAPVVPGQQALIKSRANQAMLQQVDRQMQQIVEQMKLLAKQASALRERQRISQEIYSAQMNFEPVIGNTYYLYEKGQERVLSLISPSEWGSIGKNLIFIAKVNLLADRTWEVEI